MTANLATSHTRKLTSIREKITVLKQEEEKICHDLSQELSKCLVDAEALEVDFDTLIGGILDVIAQAKTDATKVEAWRKSGLMFRQHRSQKGREKERQGKARHPFSPTTQQQKEIA